MRQRSLCLSSIVAASLLFGWSSTAMAKVWEVSTPDMLKTAFQEAVAGDQIVLDDGEYQVNSALQTSNDGAPGRPIIVRSKTRHMARLIFNTSEGLVIEHAWWVIDGVHISGCMFGCDAGVHVKPQANAFSLQNSILTDWAQHLKVSRTDTVAVRGASVVDNEFYNTQVRSSVGGSTPVDITGGANWFVARNYIHDFGGGFDGNYGVSVKGVSQDAVVEQNLIIGATSSAFELGTTYGISFGGNGTNKRFLPNGDNRCEDINSIARNNIVINTLDAGFHTNRACGSQIHHNTAYKTGVGVQVQISGDGGPVLITRNLFDGSIVGASNQMAQDNLLQVTDQMFDSYFVDPTNYQFRVKTSAVDELFVVNNISQVSDDYCGVIRSQRTAYGAVSSTNSRCSTWTWPTNRQWSGQNPVGDMGADMDMSSGPTGGGPRTLPNYGGGSTGRPDKGGCQSVPGQSPTPWGVVVFISLVCLARRKR